MHAQPVEDADYHKVIPRRPRAARARAGQAPLGAGEAMRTTVGTGCEGGIGLAGRGEPHQDSNTVRPVQQPFAAESETQDGVQRVPAEVDLSLTSRRQWERRLNAELTLTRSRKHGQGSCTEPGDTRTAHLKVGARHKAGILVAIAGDVPNTKGGGPHDRPVAEGIDSAFHALAPAAEIEDQEVIHPAGAHHFVPMSTYEALRQGDGHLATLVVTIDGAGAGDTDGTRMAARGRRVMTQVRRSAPRRELRGPGIVK